MLKIWNFPMKQTKNPNTQFEIQIGENEKSWKTNLWIVAHGGSGLFPSSTHSSGKLCGDELRCVVWWRFGQAKDGTTPEEEEEGTSRTLSSSKSFCFGDLCGGGGGSAWRKQRKQRWRRELLSEGWVSFFVLFGEGFNCLSVNLVFFTWRFLIGWHKTPALDAMFSHIIIWKE